MSGGAPSPYAARALVDVYDRLALPLQFAAPARDLVAALGLTPGARVLDVGTGTGAAATPAAAAVGPSGLVIGMDGSLEMLRRLRGKQVGRPVGGRVPALPFRAAQFDAVAATFVLSHLHDYGRGLLEMVRVLKPRGRFGATGWGATPTAVSAVWAEVIGRDADLDGLKRAFQEIVPWEEPFSQEAGFRSALAAAGLTRVQVWRREYLTSMPTRDYLTVKQHSVEGTLVREQLGAARWDALCDRLAEAFHDQFGPTVSYVRDAWLGIGTKP